MWYNVNIEEVKPQAQTDSLLRKNNKSNIIIQEVFFMEMILLLLSTCINATILFVVVLTAVKIAIKQAVKELQAEKILPPPNR